MYGQHETKDHESGSDAEMDEENEQLGHYLEILDAFSLPSYIYDKRDASFHL
jgi:hypothetical protein